MGSAEGAGTADERPRHPVKVSAFRIQRHEVTNAEFRRLYPDHQGNDQLPAGHVTWYQATTYAAWLGGRLPTEAEWEYAARAGCRYDYCGPDGQEAALVEVARTLRNSAAPDTGQPTASVVMSYQPNPWGLYDMIGNLWEWTGDWFQVYPGQGIQRDPWGPAAAGGSGGRVLRGGSCENVAGISRPAVRQESPPGNSLELQGFRAVLPLSAEP